MRGARRSFKELKTFTGHTGPVRAVATAKLLIRFIEMLEERGAEDWSSMQKILRKRAERKKRTKSPRSMESAWRTGR